MVISTPVITGVFRIVTQKVSGSLYVTHEML